MNLQEFSARKFGPEKIPDPFSDHSRKSRPGRPEMYKLDPPKSEMVCFGLPWVRLDWDLVRMDPDWYRNPLDPIWTPFGSLMDQFWAIFMFLDYCWITAGWALLLPYCWPM